MDSFSKVFKITSHLGKSKAFTLRPSRVRAVRQDSAINLRHHDCSFHLNSKLGFFYMRMDAINFFMIELQQPDKDCMVAALDIYLQYNNAETFLVA